MFLNDKLKIFIYFKNFFKNLRLRYNVVINLNKMLKTYIRRFMNDKFNFRKLNITADWSIIKQCFFPKMFLFYRETIIIVGHVVVGFDIVTLTRLPVFYL